MEGSSSQEMEEPPFLDSVLLKKSPSGSYYVEDEEGGLYEIEEFLGDIPPFSQVFRAKHTKSKADGRFHQEIVALKLARIDGSDEFSNMRQEAESSLRIGSNDGQENDVISADNIVIGIYKSFEYRGFFCVTMPYMKRGSLRYITNSRMVFRKLTHIMCAAVVLRETLKGLCFLHGRGEVHGKLHAGNIYVLDVEGPLAIKLGYKGSTYFHNPDFDNDKIPKIWDKDFPTVLRHLNFYASNSPENKFWAIDGPYEPSSEQQNSTFASDIWNFGVTAIELALGPLRNFGVTELELDLEPLRANDRRMRSPDELRAFLTNLEQNQENRLPTLYELFIADLPTPQESTSTTTTAAAATSDQSKKSAGKMMMEGMRNAAKEVKIFGKKIEEKIFEGKPKPTPRGNQPSSSFIAMVKRCLVLDPNQRPTAQMLLHDPFFVENQHADLPYFSDVIRTHD